MLVGRFACVLDACVLHTTLFKAALLELAHAGLYRLVLSEAILSEWQRSLEKRFGDPPDKSAAPVKVVRSAFAHAIVEVPPDLIDAIDLPDPEDRHVVAAALIGRASAIVTTNIEDFPADALSRYQLEGLHPDTFIVNLIDLDEARAVRALRDMRNRWKNPPYSAKQLIAALETRGMVQTALRLQRLIEPL